MRDASPPWVLCCAPSSHQGGSSKCLQCRGGVGVAKRFAYSPTSFSRYLLLLKSAARHLLRLHSPPSRQHLSAASSVPSLGVQGLVVVVVGSGTDYNGNTVIFFPHHQTMTFCNPTSTNTVRLFCPGVILARPFAFSKSRPAQYTLTCTKQVHSFNSLREYNGR